MPLALIPVPDSTVPTPDPIDPLREPEAPGVEPLSPVPFEPVEPGQVPTRPRVEYRRRRRKRSGIDAALRRAWGRPHVRRWLIIGFILAVGLGAVAYRQSRPVITARKAQSWNATAAQDIDRGDFLHAQDLLKKSLLASPAQAETWRNYARLLGALNDPDRACAEFHAWTLAPEPAQAARALIAALEETQPDLAMRFATRMQEAHPGDAAVWHLSGIAAAMHGDPRQAASWLATARRLAPDDRRIHLSEATLRVASEDSITAAQGTEFLRSVANDPVLGVPATLALAAIVATTNTEAALLLLDPVALRNPNDWLIARQHLDLRAIVDPSALPPDLQRAWDLAPTPVARVGLLWRSLDAVGPESASALFERLPQSERDSLSGLVFACELAARAGHWRDVDHLASQQIVDLMPPAQELLVMLVMLRTHQAEGNEAALRKVRDRALEIVAPDARLAEQAGALLELWGLGSLALEHYELAARNGTGRLRRDALARLAGIYHDQRDASRALRTIERLLQESPNDPVFRNNLAAYLLILNRSDVRTLPFAESAHKAEPEHPEFAETYARALTAANRPAEALALLDALPDSAKKLSSVLLTRALALKAAGRPAESREVAARIDAPSLFPEDRKLVDPLRTQAGP
jgi:tetratricopeptide (TPR) repeat protein